MFSRLALKPSRRVFSASQITQTSSRSAYYHFRRKWTPHEYDELKEKRELLRAVTDKDAILAKLKERMNDPEKADWPPLTSLTKRVGVVGKKLGHCTYWLRNGKPMPCCMVQVLDNIVLDTDVLGPNRRTGVYVASGNMSQKEIDETPDWKLERFRSRSIHPRQAVHFISASVDALVPPKTILSTSHFRINQFVDIYGTTIDRGFQGVMRRHGFKGQPSTHGNSLSHRVPGSIGNRLDGLWRGSKMPGHMGNKWRYTRCLRVLRINHKFNILYIHGRNLPGSEGDWVVIKDSMYIRPGKAVPYPTHLPPRDLEVPEEEFWDGMVKPWETLTFEGDGGKAEAQLKR